MSHYIIVRPPSTQEDEGRYFLEATAATKGEAKAKVRQLIRDCKGYYSFKVYKEVSS